MKQIPDKINHDQPIKMILKDMYIIIVCYNDLLAQQVIRSFSFNIKSQHLKVDVFRPFGAMQSYISVTFVVWCGNDT
jgi:hypothetical protein